MYGQKVSQYNHKKQPSNSNTEIMKIALQFSWNFFLSEVNKRDTTAAIEARFVSKNEQKSSRWNLLFRIITLCEVLLCRTFYIFPELTKAKFGGVFSLCSPLCRPLDPSAPSRCSLWYRRVQLYRMTSSREASQNQSALIQGREASQKQNSFFLSTKIKMSNNTQAKRTKTFQKIITSMCCNMMPFF